MKQQSLGVDLIDYLGVTAHERAEKYNVTEVMTWPKLTDYTTPVYLGSFSWTLPNDHERLIYHPTALYPFGIPQTPAEITRDYLDWKYPQRQRCTTAQYHEIIKPRSFPRMVIAETTPLGKYPSCST